MPLLTLEYSDNILEKEDLRDLLAQLHLILEKKLPTQLESCQSRAVSRPVFVVGNGDDKNAFVFVSIRVLSGRTPQVLQETCAALMESLTAYFANSLEVLQLQLSLEINEIGPYFSKTLSAEQ